MSGEMRPRTRPDQSWTRLWRAVQPHAIPPGVLGEYAEARRRRGEVIARRHFPEVATHLAGGCPECEQDLADLADIFDEELAQQPRGVAWGDWVAGIPAAREVSIAAALEAAAPAMPAPVGDTASAPEVASTSTFQFRFSAYPDIVLRAVQLGNFAILQLPRVPRPRARRGAPLEGWLIRLTDLPRASALAATTDSRGFVFFEAIQPLPLEQATIEIFPPA